ncbi:CaiB/BaiF CoA transferase family protein [Paraferrimonas sedimenticola]|uniref:CoA transferase n=1 Tax=Paraferrimonas sedimenticola TaxID=375674 RepID=A0AA37RWG0_9GAMM|nr:CoA transferase [Paraferrimonas sedimenticola]GLP96323.1 CoA transferase [Paraferrimonas sedimenticola]
MADLPLSGVRIIAVEQYGAGPYGSAYLADMGAEIIKIENPKTKGDISRQTGPYFLGENDSYFYQTFNGNKKSLSLNLKSEQGWQVFERLVKSADAVYNNLRGDQPAKLGITYDHLKSINPKIVCCHLSAYGRDNDRASWPGYDYLMQAEAGLMSLTGEPENGPNRFGVSMVDFMTGAVAALGLTSAMLGAHRQGKGRDVDVSLFDVALHQLTYPATWYLNKGHVTERMPHSAHPATVPCQWYPTADGHVFVMAMTDKFWQALVDEIQDARLSEARFVGFAERRDNRTELNEILDECFSARTTAQWLEAFQGRLPIAPIYDMAQALTNPYIEQLGLKQQVSHSQNPQMQLLSNPIKIDGQRLQANAAVARGQDTQDLLEELGFDRAAQRDLSDSGAI